MEYLDLEDVINIHNEIILNFDGLGGINNEGQIDSVLTHIQNDIYYPDFIEKLVHLFFGLIQFHCFNDGNKRTAIIATDVFLKINNVSINDFVVKMEDIAVGVAKGEIAKDDLKKIFKSMFISFNVKY